MEYAAVTSLAQTTHQILNDDRYPYSSLPGRETIKSIYDQAIFLQGFLQDFPEKAISLEGEIRDVGNQVEDIIDYWLTSPEPSISECFLRDLEIGTEETAIDNTYTASTSSPIPDHNLMAVKSLLCEESSQLQVISLFGIIGKGKITLVRNLYHDPLIKEHFEIRAWICDDVDLFIALEESDAEEWDPSFEYLSSSAYDCGENRERVNRRLKGRRYLILMDDLRGSGVWHEIKNVFPDDNNGSRIVLITSLSANLDLNGSVYEMCLMDEDQTHELEKARETIVSISEQVKTIKNSFRMKDEQRFCDSPAATPQEHAPTQNDDMIGFEDELMAIKSLLCGQSSQLQVISIFGMGGIGKTTLARNAYDDPLIVRYFDIRVWVTISQHYSAQEILLKLLLSVEEFKAEGTTESNDVKVYQILKGRRYLIVMDDVWSTEAWDEVRNIFPDDGNGSRIMLTTRLLDVAGYPHLCSSIYEMQFMNEDQSWNLLRHKVFSYQDCPIELEYIGKEIAKNCRGLPLAIVVIAGILSTVSKNQASWAGIAENVNSVVAGNDRQFEEILSLSYTHLPHHLRPCFLYMGAFPEDHEIRVSKIIKLWVAEAFLKRPNGLKSFEEEAEECLENLVKRSLVLVIERKKNGKIKSCSLHDLMRDLCIRKANEEKFLANIRDISDENELSNQRRISVAFLRSPYILRNCSSAIHTIMWFIYTSLPSIESFSLLRVLDAGDADVSSILTELFELFHLRYLAINCPGENIPAEISKLQNLQTLIIRARGQWKLYVDFKDCLPQEIWRMPQLRHLVFYGMLPDPEGTSSSALSNLQTLCFSLSHNTGMERILKMFPNLKKLKINYYFSPYSPYVTNLVCLHQLEIFDLCSKSDNTVWQKNDLTLPRMLKKLTLTGLRLPWNEIGTVCSSLPSLQVLKLKKHACRGSKWKTSEGEFPQLEFLLIQESYIECWITESSHFPRLKFLLIHDCFRLNEIPVGIGEIPTLELIEVKGHMKTSLVQSANRIQEEQQDLGNYDLQVRGIVH